MDEDRIHRAVSNDGTEIAGQVHGQGPPLVLVHGSFEDGDLDWAAMLPFVSERFTCGVCHRRPRAARATSRPSSRSSSRRPGPKDLARPTRPCLRRSRRRSCFCSRSALRHFFTEGVRHVAEHVSDTRMREVAGGGHWGVALAPEPIADELVRFLAAAPRPA